VPTSPTVLRRAIQAVAARQAGYFTASQAVLAGYSYQSQKHHVDHGNWQRVGRGLFRLPDWPDGPTDQYVQWWLWSRGQAVISHETALTVHDLGDVNPAQIHLTVPPPFRARHPAVRLHHATVPSSDVEACAGFRITTVERSLLDVAGGSISQEQVDAAVADGLTEGLVTPLQLRSRSDEFGDRAALRIERALGAAGR
jgi:predicted transcriptional regulator of viral defense system